MALTLSIETDQSLELEDYTELVDRKLDRDDFDSLVESAVLLKKLANNRRILIEHVNQRLCDHTNSSAKDVGDTSFCLARRKQIRVRANVWVPPTEMPMSRKWQANISAYLTPHDHSFSFVTVGYLGTGYETTIFEYDRSRTAGKCGETVSLQFLEKTRLTQGKVMVYRANKDVHFQAHPQDFSISLNLVVFPREFRDQYMFDINRSIITSRAMDFRGMQSLMCTLAGALGDGSTMNVLEKVARRNCDEEVRASAFTAWARLDPDHAAQIWKMALEDAHESVRTLASAELGTLV